MLYWIIGLCIFIGLIKMIFLHRLCKLHYRLQTKYTYRPIFKIFIYLV
jgi:hypothetical protein